MANTVIGSSMIIEGDISGEEELLIRGTVKGTITLTDSLLVENSAVVEADIRSASATINGQVTGNITASERVELRADSRMVGNITSRRILIADGATLKGSVDMET